MFAVSVVVVATVLPRYRSLRHKRNGRSSRDCHRRGIGDSARPVGCARAPAAIDGGSEVGQGGGRIRSDQYLIGSPAQRSHVGVSRSSDGDRLGRGGVAGRGQRAGCVCRQANTGGRQQASGDADVAGPAAGRIAEVDVGRRGREHRRAVEGGVAADPVDFCLDRRELGIQRRTLRVGHGAGGRFGGQRNRAIQQRGDLGERAVGHLQVAHAIVCVAGRLRQGGDVGMQAIGNGQAGCVIGAAVDAGTGGQPEQGFLQFRSRDRQLVLGGQGRNIIQNAKCHFEFLL